MAAVAEATAGMSMETEDKVPIAEQGWQLEKTRLEKNPGFIAGFYWFFSR